MPDNASATTSSFICVMNFRGPVCGPSRFCIRPRWTEQHRTFTLSIGRYSEAIVGLLLSNQLTAGRLGAHRLQLVIIPRVWGCSIPPSMFHQMLGLLRLHFMTIEIILALMCWLIFTWHNLSMVALTGSPISGLLLYQPMLRSLHSLSKVTC